MEQLGGSLRTLELMLSTETLARLDTIFPGPGPALKSHAS